jgi:hypothetical protein
LEINRAENYCTKFKEVRVQFLLEEIRCRRETFGFVYKQLLQLSIALYRHGLYGRLINYRGAKQTVVSIYAKHDDRQLIEIKKLKI